jgi:hypothetical protein
MANNVRNIRNEALLDHNFLKKYGYNISDKELSKLVEDILYDNFSLNLDPIRREQRKFAFFSQMRNCPDKFISYPVRRLYNKLLQEITDNKINHDENMDIALHSLDDIKNALENLNEKKELWMLVNDLNPLTQSIFKNFLRNLGVWID